MSKENPKLDEQVWQAWLNKNAQRDGEFFLKVKVGGAVLLVLAIGLLLGNMFW